MPKQISVVIPVYNVEQYLRQCLDSLGVLGREDVEVILVNDGSTDGSRAICAQYQERYSNVILIDKQNGGLSDARNKGTEAATGEYICYVDSDDWLEPDAINTLYEYAIANDCEIVQGSFYYAFNDYLEHNDRYFKADDAPFVMTREEAMKQLLKNLYVKNFAWGKIYKTSIAKAHYFPFGKYFEDSYWQFLMIHDCERYGVICEPLYYYRQRRSSISGGLGANYIDLIKGNETRLSFISNHYPDLTELAADAIWRNSFVMRERGKNMELIFQKIHANYSPLLSSDLRNSLLYKLVDRKSLWLPLYMFLKRLNAFIRRKPLKKMNYPE